jgi:hypothetical protein
MEEQKCLFKNRWSGTKVHLLKQSPAILYEKLGHTDPPYNSVLSNAHRALVSPIENAGERRWISQKP